MSILNDVERIRAVDPANMYNRIFDLPEQMEDAIRIGTHAHIRTSDFADIKNIVVVGMGGSAIGGDLARTLLASKLQIPFHVCRHYVVPEYVDDETLVIASSYSGNTEETLSALDDALSRKAMIVAISTGGLLTDVSTLNDFPLIVVPSGFQPRAALGYSFVPLLIFLEKIGLIKNVADELNRLIGQLKNLREDYIEDVPVENNPAKQLAEQIHGRIAIIYSGPTLTDAVGLRWKGQICENAKNLAFANNYAEFNHNELVGWSETVQKHQDQLIVIQLRDRDDHPQITKRMNIVKGLIEDRGIKVVDVESQGDSSLTRMFSLIQLGDFVSYYLAVLNEVDPTPVKVIETLKGMLSGK
ncbi:MAG: bifunctional phosphoglucose/phosphomannose isomerase [Candidatus Zixiibacteriota bacterium]|nr:MAG: bifunctional phosphoglucose/phosphomannose isomerase [candidate division Zixibacteria bacterium]